MEDGLNRICENEKKKGEGEKTISYKGKERMLSLGTVRDGGTY